MKLGGLRVDFLNVSYRTLRMHCRLPRCVFAQCIFVHVQSYVCVFEWISQSTYGRAIPRWLQPVFPMLL